MLQINLFSMRTVSSHQLNPGKQGHGIAVLNNHMYVIGGNTVSVERYNLPKFEKDSQDIPNLPMSCRNTEATVLDGRIYIIGVFNGNYQNLCYKYDEIENTWTDIASLSLARNAIGVAAFNGHIYAVGGYNGSHLDIVERYDPATNLWRKVRVGWFISIYFSYSLSHFTDESTHHR